MQHYGATIEKAGFGEVEAVDNTKYFMSILEDEMSRFVPMKAEMVRDFSLADYTSICEGWKQKLDRCRQGDQAWGYFRAQKQFK